MKNKLLYILLCLFVVGCNTQNSTPNKNTNSSSHSSIITGIINGPTSIAVGDLVTYKLDSNQQVSWESTDALILNINSKGEAIAFKEGSVTIIARDTNSNVIASLNVTVENKVNLPTSELELSNLFQTAISLEKEGSTYHLKRLSSEIEQTYTQEAKIYDDFYINETEDIYTNHTGSHHEITTEYKGIKDGYYYDISDSNENSYGIKRKIVNNNATEYEILESEAKERIVGPRFINQFYTRLSDMWGARTLDLSIVVEELEDSFKLHLKNTYLFVWYDGISNDSRLLEATLEFANDGFFLSGHFKETEYIEHQYDVAKNDWIDNPQVKDTEEYLFSAVRGEKHDSTEVEINPKEYFVTSVTEARYTMPVVVGDYINTNYITLVNYEGDKSIDIDYFTITGIQNDDNLVCIVKDTTNGGYIAISEGTAYLVCQMSYSPEVVFLVEIEVLGVE